MPPPRNTTAYQGLQPQNGTEQGQSEEVLLLVALLLIYVVFGLLLILHTGWNIVVEATQQRGATEPPLSVEETNPHRGPYESTYD
ncbi:hypothetical protein ANANG_G00077330 [Anguilla anguilla]|uniref:Uncharacterized protein n=1 Tax=Anguilla anguilla TaxID=7936 RepID=A0A9D3MJH7_ANGAN|nr:hypothetical protein ANANG_G00077330 [Anguilla anguilla]